jgi:preprotein translocase subunit SecF
MEQNNKTTLAGGNKRVGPIVVTLIVVLILVIIGLYIFATKIGPPDISYMTDQTSSTTAQVQTVQTAATVQPITNTADDVQSLRNDLKTSTNGVDSQNF